MCTILHEVYKCGCTKEFIVTSFCNMGEDIYQIGCPKVVIEDKTDPEVCAHHGIKLGIQTSHKVEENPLFPPFTKMI